MGLIPQEVISQILDRASIVDVIAEYIPLKQAGRNFKAPCPFHHEKTPSFVVNPDKQIFHCFGCGVGGNVVTFIMKQERMDFPEVLRILAQKTGVAIPVSDIRNNQANEIRQQILSVNELSVKYYHQALLSDKSEIAKTAREYLKNRGLGLESVVKFQLGLALEQWDGLLKFLRSQNFSASFLEKAGLVIAKNQNDGYYDRFRERVVFPIFNARAEVVAFGARSLDQNNPAKYINSPETPLYTKGKYLYGLNWAKDAIGRQDAVIVVEGYMDFITPYVAGVENIVASLGTALTVEQIRLMRRYTKNVVMLFDADPAGQAAMLRSLDLLVQEGMSVKVAALSPGEDPDSFVRKFGAPAFLQCVTQAQSLFDFKIKVLLKKYSSGRIEDNAKIAGEMLTTIVKFDNAIVQAEYVKRLAQVLMIEPEALSLEMRKVKPIATLMAADGEPSRKLLAQQIRPVERSLLRLMLEEKDFIPLSRRDIALTDLQNQHVRDIVAKIFELFDKGCDPTVTVLMSCFEEQGILDMISGIVSSEEFIAGDRQKIYRDCTLRLRQENLKNQRQDILRQMEVARNNDDHKALEELSYAFNQLIKGS
ncbi:MAG: DNA primase [Candidatus Omnitrophica bacterium]|nr:DNA primase [Candidatus Omnitrophota bacterium]